MPWPMANHVWPAMILTEAAPAFSAHAPNSRHVTTAPTTRLAGCPATLVLNVFQAFACRAIPDGISTARLPVKMAAHVPTVLDAPRTTTVILSAQRLAPSATPVTLQSPFSSHVTWTKTASADFVWDTTTSASARRIVKLLPAA